MDLIVNRRLLNPLDSIGDLSINGVFQCFTLEPTMREISGQPVSSWKIQDKTAIPVGRYRLTLTYSPKFQRTMPLLVAVPGYEGVRLHWGNYPGDTDGCILTGQQQGTDEVLASKLAFEALYPKIQSAVNGEGAWITINNPPGA